MNNRDESEIWDEGEREEAIEQESMRTDTRCFF